MSAPCAGLPGTQDLRLLSAAQALEPTPLEGHSTVLQRAGEGGLTPHLPRGVLTL